MSDPSTTSSKLTATPADVSVEQIRPIVAADKARGMEAIKMAGHEVRNFKQQLFVTDITGKPDPNRAYGVAKREQYRGLEAMSRKPFYRRINVRRDIDGEVESVQILITEARGAGGIIQGDDWMVVSFSSTLGTQLEGKRPGEKVIVRTNRGTVEYEVGESSKYELLLPQFENAEFYLSGGDAAFRSEADLDASAMPATSLADLPPKAYVAKPTFGLSDIIVLRDDPQIGAMALPFGDTVVIDGPPGSGKTSIGIMRIASLYDRQWDELGLSRDHDKPFHDYSTMRVLVYNDEMVEYLKALTQSIGVEHVQVSTTYDFFRRICQQTKLLSGTPRKDRPSLAVMKGRREALRAYFAGFKAHATRYWESQRDDLRGALFALGPDFLVLADRLADWIERIKKASVIDDRITGQIGIAGGLSTAIDSIRQEQSPTRRARSAAGDVFPKDERIRELGTETLQKRFTDAKQLMVESLRGAFSRAGSTTAMFGLAEYVALKESLKADGVPAKTIEDADRLWRKQYAGPLPAYSELDLATSAWLGAKLLLLTDATRKPWIGGQLDRLTHVVVDEVQDLSPSHLAVLASQLSDRGTMTLVGDIHQNLNPHAGLRRWEDVGLPNVKLTIFGVNHRQTLQLGTFMKALHAGLFTEQCVWEASPKAIGPIPRAGIARSWKVLARAIAHETRYWREMIGGNSGATVAVL